MPDPIRQLTLVQFSHLLKAATLSRKIVEIHIHHTWRPRRLGFSGLDTMEAMRRYHVETNHWSDIAQHLTVDPQGLLWTGRNWNQPPASAIGHNGTLDAGPFMIEMVGDFNTGQDPFDGVQREVAVGVVARLLTAFKLPMTAVKFHRDLGSPKTCPGSGIDRAAFVALVTKAQRQLATLGAAKARAAASPFKAEHLIGHAAVRAWSGSLESPDPEITEDAGSARAYEDMTQDAARARQLDWRRSAGAGFAPRGGGGDAPEWRELRPHVVNLSRGELSAGGQFSTSPQDLVTIIEGIDRFGRLSSDPLRILLYAHGGLVTEKGALAYAKAMAPWWMANRVYPVFFAWESGLFEIVRQFLVGPRDFWDYTTDPALEVVAKIPGTLAWNGMKESARRASAADTGNGAPGGAHRFAGLLADFVRGFTNKPVTIHAAGHSAGSIFHAHLLPLLAAKGLQLATTSFLAPAVRVDLFKEKLLPLVRSGQSGKLSMFTMEEDAERQDNCARVYRKSLLYLISRSFEGVSRKPILGLQEHIRKDNDLAMLFGISGAAASGATPHAELHLSFAPGHDPNPLTRALAHGCFDNDSYTMYSVLHRIRGEADDVSADITEFPEFDDGCAFGPASPAPPRDRELKRSGTGSTGAAAGRRMALCVGIDAYPEKPLAGCTSDARTWGRSLENLGFEVTYLFDAAATRQGLVDAVRRMIGAARPGDVLVWQYSGHGTQMKDLNGDESDGFDEALVPFDYASGRLLIDDDIGDMLRQLPAGVLMTLFMDCCHPGTNSRFAPLTRAVDTSDERARYLPPTPALVEAHMAFRAGHRPAGPSGPEVSMPGIVHLAACQDNEYAWETRGQGDFTAAAAPLLARAVRAGHTNEAFLEEIRRTVTARGRQHPMMMPPPPELRERDLLVPMAGASLSGAAPAGATSLDEQLLAHVEAMAALLRARVVRSFSGGGAPGGRR